MSATTAQIEYITELQAAFPASEWAMIKQDIDYSFLTTLLKVGGMFAVFGIIVFLLILSAGVVTDRDPDTRKHRMWIPSTLVLLPVAGGILWWLISSQTGHAS